MLSCGAVSDYMTPPGTVAEGMNTPRLHAVRVESSARPGPGESANVVIPNTLNTRYRLDPNDITAAVPWELQLEAPFIASEHFPEVQGFAMLNDVGFVGVGSSLTQSDLDALGIEIDEETGEFVFNADVDVFPVINLQDQLFLTSQEVPGNSDFIGSGGTRSFRGDAYPLVLAPADRLIVLDTEREIAIDRPVSVAIERNSLVSLVERVVPPSDDTRTVWGALADFKTRNEVVAGLDNSGNVEQQQTVDRAMFEVRADGKIAGGQYLRDEAGRLWEIIGVADHLRNRRNVVLVCERVFDRRRRPSTFPRFAVPIRRV